MRKYEQRTYQYEERVDTTCDICGAYIPIEDAVDDEVIISKTDRGYTTETYIDMCPDCFNTVFSHWLSTMGIVPHIRGIK